MKTTRKLLSLLIIFTFIGTAFGIAFAANEFAGNGNDRKGKYLFRKSCRACHDGSKAADLSPNSKTQAQWERAFEKFERLECADEWKKMSQEELNDVYTYLHGHAYDSPQPATCE